MSENIDQTVEDILVAATKVAPDKDNVRYSRWAVPRVSFHHLRIDLVEYLTDRLPNAEILRASGRTTCTVDAHLDDGTRIVAEFVGFIVKSADDIAKLRGMLFTGASVDTMDMPFDVHQQLRERVLMQINRYPRKAPT